MSPPEKEENDLKFLLVEGRQICLLTQPYLFAFLQFPVSCALTEVILDLVTWFIADSNNAREAAKIIPPHEIEVSEGCPFSKRQEQGKKVCKTYCSAMLTLMQQKKLCGSVLTGPQ